MTDTEFAEIDWLSYHPRIECRGADTLPLDALEEFQGKLKKRTKKDIEKIMRSIYEYGFSFPFACWINNGRNMVLDGHGRLLALTEMRKRGTDLPLFPVVYVSAHDEDEAKQKLLRLNSAYGAMTLDSVLEFAGDIHLDAGEISLPGISFERDDDSGDESEIVGDISDSFIITVHTDSPHDAADLYTEMKERGFTVEMKGA